MNDERDSRNEYPINVDNCMHPSVYPIQLYGTIFSPKIIADIEAGDQSTIKAFLLNKWSSFCQFHTSWGSNEIILIMLRVLVNKKGCSCLPMIYGCYFDAANRSSPKSYKRYLPINWWVLKPFSTKIYAYIWWNSAYEAYIVQQFNAMYM